MTGSGSRYSGIRIGGGQSVLGNIEGDLHLHAHTRGKVNSDSKLGDENPALLY